MQRKDLTKKIGNLKKEIGDKAKSLICSFSSSKGKNNNLELCFCILVANTSLKKTKEIWEELGDKLLSLNEKELSLDLKQMGYRFYNKRAGFLVGLRPYLEEFSEVARQKNAKEIRQWLVKNIKGIGFKEASHFLRNIGHDDFAILDRHVLKMLKEYNIIKGVPKTLTPKKYLEIEGVLEKIAKELKISMAELDAYLFYLSSGRLPEK